MVKRFTTMLMLFAVFFTAAIAAERGDARELTVEWLDKKVNITAKGVTVCDVLEELGEKTNTKIYNANECDSLINLRIEKQSFDYALRELLRHDSYVLVEDETGKKLMVYDRNSNQTGDNSAVSYEVQSPQTYIPDTTQTETTNFVDVQQVYDQPQDANIVNLREPLPYPSEPPFNPAVLENDAGYGAPILDPSTVFANPMGIPYP